MATIKDTASDHHVGLSSEKERSEEVDIDVERDGVQPSVQRTMSEPPFSVFSKGMKTWIIFLVSASLLVAPIGATMFLPALNVLSDVLHITPA